MHDGKVDGRGAASFGRRLTAGCGEGRGGPFFQVASFEQLVLALSSDFCLFYFPSVFTLVSFLVFKFLVFANA